MRLRRRDTQEESQIELPAIVGRQHDCDLVIDDASVSRRHLEISQGSSGPFAKDLGSSNGSKHNGRPIKACVLRNGDLLTIGAIAFDVVISPKAEAYPTQGISMEKNDQPSEAPKQPASHRVRSERARAEARQAKRSNGLGDLSQLSVASQTLVAIAGIAFVAGIAYLVKWLGGAL